MPAEAAGSLFAAPRIEPGEVRWDGADADGRWSVVAGAWRGADDGGEADPSLALPIAPSLKRNAMATDFASGHLALDALRSLGFGQQVEVHFGARRAALSLRDDTTDARGSLDERASSRTLRSQVEATFAWSQPGRWGPFAWARSLAIRMASDTEDARALIDAGWNGVRSVLRRDDAAERRVSLEGRQGFELPRDLAFEGGVRLERQRLEADPAEGPGAFVHGTRIASHAELCWTPASPFGFFARATRGAEDALSSGLARNPFGGGVAVGANPESLAMGSDAGARWTLGPWRLAVSAWRRKLPYSLGFSEGGARVTPFASDRHGFSTTLAWRPASWVAVDTSIFLDRSREADGPALPGAPQVFGSAGATMRMSREWDAKLRVNYLGPRDAIEDAPSLKGTTLANLEVVRWFGRTTRISLDVFNVFNQRPVAVDSFAAARTGLADGTGESFLSSPSEPRAFLLKFRTRF